MVKGAKEYGRYGWYDAKLFICAAHLPSLQYQLGVGLLGLLVVGSLTCFLCDAVDVLAPCTATWCNALQTRWLALYWFAHTCKYDLLIQVHTHGCMTTVKPWRRTEHVLRAS